MEFYRRLYDEGKPSPLDTMPEMDRCEQLYFSDFNLLGSERSSGMGVSAIPVTRIIEYAILEGIHDKSMFREIITAVDREYLIIQHKKQETERRRKK